MIHCTYSLIPYFDCMREEYKGLVPLKTIYRNLFDTKNDRSFRNVLFDYGTCVGISLHRISSPIGWLNNDFDSWKWKWKVIICQEMSRNVRNCHEVTMWKFSTFPAILILREINFGWFRKVKNCYFNNFGGFEFWLLEKFHNWKYQELRKIQNSELLKWSKCQFWGF